MGSTADERFSRLRLECCGDEESLEDVEGREEEGRLTGLPGLEAARGCLNTDSSSEEGGLGLGFGIGSSVFTNPFFSTGFLILGGRTFLGSGTVSASWSPSPRDTEGDIGDSGSLKGAHLSWNLERSSISSSELPGDLTTISGGRLGSGVTWAAEITVSGVTDIVKLEDTEDEGLMRTSSASTLIDEDTGVTLAGLTDMAEVMLGVSLSLMTVEDVGVVDIESSS